MVKQLTAQTIFSMGNVYSVRKYWFTFLVEYNGVEFIIDKKTGWIYINVDKTKVKWGKQ